MGRVSRCRETPPRRLAGARTAYSLSPWSPARPRARPLPTSDSRTRSRRTAASCSTAAWRPSCSGIGSEIADPASSGAHGRSIGRPRRCSTCTALRRAPAATSSRRTPGRSSPSRSSRCGDAPRRGGRALDGRRPLGVRLARQAIDEAGRAGECAVAFAISEEANSPATARDDRAARAGSSRTIRPTCCCSRR